MDINHSLPWFSLAGTKPLPYNDNPSAHYKDEDEDKDVKMKMWRYKDEDEDEDEEKDKDEDEGEDEDVKFDFIMLNVFFLIWKWICSNVKFDLFQCEMGFLQMFNGICLNMKFDLFWFDIWFVLMWKLNSSITKMDYFLNVIVWYKLGFMFLTWTHGIDL